MNATQKAANQHILAQAFWEGYLKACKDHLIPDSYVASELGKVLLKAWPGAFQHLSIMLQDGKGNRTRGAAVEQVERDGRTHRKAQTRSARKGKKLTGKRLAQARKAAAAARAALALKRKQAA